MRHARRGSLLALAVVAVLTVQGTALATTAEVSIVDFAFNPPSVKVKQGDTVHWTNVGDQFHTSTSDGFDGTSGVRLWDSGLLDTGDDFNFVFTTAAKYPYHCTVHDEMRGSVSVAMKASPSTGGTGDTFRITWARGSIPTGFNADIQIKRPGSANFVDWMPNQEGTMTRADFTPDAGAGVYSFRSRLQKNSTGGVSQFSKAKSITVT